MASIEGAFIGLARYIRDHFPHLTWMPLWYGGIPFPDSYPPLLHVTVAAVSALAHISAGLAYHAVDGHALFARPLSLSTGPLSRMGATTSLRSSPRPATRSSRPPSGWSRSFRHDIGGWFAPCRLDAMVRWGEGPHIASLTLLPLAIGALYVAIIAPAPAGISPRRWPWRAPR